MKLTRLKSERPRRPHDYYPTPYGLAHESLISLYGDELFVRKDKLSVLDAGAGDGTWGYALRVIGISSWLCGVEIDKSISRPSAYDEWRNEDYLNMEVDKGFDLVMGNPPYSLMEEFIRTSHTFLNPHGYIFFLGRLEFLASKKRAKGLFTELPPKRVYVLARRPSFFSTNGRKTTDAQDYALYLWQSKFRGNTEIDWMYWDYDKDLDYT